MDAGVKTPQYPHHSIYSLLYIKYYNQLDSRSDLSPIPVRSAVKSYKTSGCIQNLSKRVLNRQTVSTSTMSPRVEAYLSGILIHPSVWPQ